MKLMWASSYLKGTFFVGMRSNQKCESINIFRNRFMNCKLKLYQFVERIDVAIDHIQNNELEDDYKSHHMGPIRLHV